MILDKEEFSQESFGGSLPRFLGAFTRKNELSSKDLDELQRKIDEHKEGSMLDHIFLSSVNLQLTACYVILFVLFLRFFLGKQPKIYSYDLWSVVLFRLLCSFSFESVWSLSPKRTEVSQTFIAQTIANTAVPIQTTTTTVPTETTIDLPTVPMEQVQTVTEHSLV